MTVADALALAGGASADGRRDRVELLRGGEKVVVKLDPAARLGDTPIRSGDQLYVPERSWFSRNQGIVIGTVSAFAALAIRLALN
jgi:protein involved in polysaccharide export with SLBB domain